MLRLAFDFIITWRETRTRPNAYAKNEKGKNQSKIACKNIGNAKVCFSRIRKHVCTRIFPYSYTYVQTCADVCMYNYMSKIKFHIKDKGVF